MLAGILITAAAVVWLVLIAVGAEVMATTLGGLELAVPAVVIVGAIALRWVVLPAGPWMHLPSRARMRRIGQWIFDADQLDELSAAIATGDPRIFLPLPPETAGGPVYVEAWAADAERLAWVQVVWGATRQHQRETPFVEIRGDGYTALAEAEAKHGLIAAARV